MADILIADIETSLMTVYTHYIGNKVSISHKQIKEHSKIISISWKWFKGKGVDALHWKESNHDDTQMLKEFNKVARGADAIVAHNGANFDIKELRGAIAIRGLADSWCETPCIDTLSDYRRMFRFKSNRLDAIAAHIGVARKSPMEMQDWIDVENNVPGALAKMIKYNKQDVVVLEQVYEWLEPYVVPTARTRALKCRNVKLIHPKCDECGSTHVVKYGLYYTTGFQKYLCKSCNHILVPDKDKGRK